MGMAASQARFLGLTARKTNVEFEGQQINQQRTTLGNQSANYYNSLLGMSVPVPPSVQDFTKTVYTFQDGNLNNSITALVATKNGEYKVSYVSSWQNDFAPVSAGAAIVFDTGKKESKTVVTKVTLDDIDYTRSRSTELETTFVCNGKSPIIYKATENKYYQNGSEVTPTTTSGTVDYAVYAVGNNTLRSISTTSAIPTDSDGKYTGNPPDRYLSSLSKDQITQLNEQEHEYTAILRKKYGEDTNWLVRYVEDTTSGVWNPVFYQEDIVRAAQYNDDTGASQSNIPSYKIGSAMETEEVKGVKARLEKDATGRYINITLMPSDDVELTYSLTTSTTTDQEAYNDAMNQYEFDKYTYDKNIQEINAKIEIVQAQDRNLELRLKQLDTEQEAIQTEMEAVEKVINKNTESTFKTFG